MTPVKRVFANFRLLVFGRVCASVLNLVAITVMARAINLNEFGTVVLVFVYLLTIRVLANLKPFLAVIRWGVPALDSGDRDTLTRLLVLTNRIDWCAAATAMLLGVLLAPLVGTLLGWSDRIIGYAMAFSVVLLASGTGTATGVLRLMDRFDAIAIQNAVGPAVRCLGALGAWYYEAPMDAFVAIWCVSLGMESLYLAWRGRRECRVHGYRFSPFHKTSLASFPGFPRFLGIAYVQTVLDLVPHRFSTIMVGAVLGAESAGLFRAASECYTVVARPAVMLRQVVFPDLTRLWVDSVATFRSVVWRVCGIAGLIGACFVVPSVFFGDWFMGTLFGDVFGVAGGLLTWLLVSAAFELGGAALRPAGYAMNRAGAMLAGSVVGTGALLIGFYPLTQTAGLTGAGVAVGLGALVTWLGMVWVITRQTGGTR